MGTLAIKDEEARLVKGIVALIRPQAKIYAFGSRARGEARKSSDMDILLREENKIPTGDILEIKELMKASSLPFSVDVVDWHDLGEGFRNAIENDLMEM